MYFEDFKLMQELETGERTVTPEDIDRFIDLSGLNNRIFLSDEGAQSAGHPRRLAPGPLMIAIAMGLAQQSGIFDQAVAVAQFDALRFLRPSHPGDTVKLFARVIDLRPASNPDRGVVVFNYTLRNQRQEILFTTMATYVMLRRPTG